MYILVKLVEMIVYSKSQTSRDKVWLCFESPCEKCRSGSLRLILTSATWSEKYFRLSVRNHQPSAYASLISQWVRNSVVDRTNQKFPLQPTTFNLLMFLFYEQIHMFIHILIIRRWKYWLGSLLGDSHPTPSFWANRCSGFMINVCGLMLNRNVVMYL